MGYVVSHLCFLRGNLLWIKYFNEVSGKLKHETNFGSLCFRDISCQTLDTCLTGSVAPVCQVVCCSDLYM